MALVTVALTLAVVLTGAAQTTSLSLVSTAWSPFTNTEGKPRFALDLVEAAFGRVGISSTTTIVAPGEFTSALFSGRYDGSAAAWKDESRERALEFSEPYLENRLILVGRRGTDVSPASFAALRGKRIAVVEGYSYGDIDGTGPTFVRMASDEAGLTGLLGGSVDYVLMDELVVRHLTSAYPKESQERLVFGEQPLLVRPLFLAVSKTRIDAQSIVRRFNGQLRAMIADGTYHRLLHVDWILSDVDGDGLTEYVPSGDRLGTSQPDRAYAISTTTTAGGTLTDATIEARAAAAAPRFYVGGNLYRDWASVPDSYKVPAEDRSLNRASGSIFTFRW